MPNLTLVSSASELRKFMDPDGETHPDMRRMKMQWHSLRAFALEYQQTPDHATAFQDVLDVIELYTRDCSDLLGR